MLIGAARARTSSSKPFRPPFANDDANDIETQFVDPPATDFVLFSGEMKSDDVAVTGRVLQCATGSRNVCKPATQNAYGRATARSTSPTPHDPSLTVNVGSVSVGKCSGCCRSQPNFEFTVCGASLPFRCTGGCAITDRIQCTADIAGDRREAMHAQDRN